MHGEIRHTSKILVIEKTTSIKAPLRKQFSGPLGPRLSFRGVFRRAITVGAFLLSIFSVSKIAAPGKSIRIIVGSTTGSLYDQWAHLLARYMPKHIPGEPNMIVQNMPGSSGLVAANYAYNVAAPDGLTLVMFHRHVYIEELIERKEAKFDARRFHWIGSPDKSVPILYIRADSPYKSIDDILKAARPPRCGAIGTSDLTYSMGKVLEVALGVRMNPAVGYSGGAEIDAAIQTGELSCRVTSLDVHFNREPFQTWHKTGFDRHLLLFGWKRHSRVPDVPTIHELLEQRKVPDRRRRVAEVFLAGNELGRPMVAPPGTPAEVVKILRTAYARVFSDPAFLVEVKRSKLQVDPSSGQELQELFGN
jgi:tripartite-type tricarboxylate transporter receptor subunit TctC